MIKQRKEDNIVKAEKHFKNLFLKFAKIYKIKEIEEPTKYDVSPMGIKKTTKKFPVGLTDIVRIED